MPYGEPHSKGQQPCFVHISIPAWEGLRRLARQYDTAQVARLLMRLPSTPHAYMDCRPSNLTDYDLVQLEHGRFPIWNLSNTRYPRHMSIAPASMAKMLAVAEHFHITDHTKTTSHASTMSRVGAVLEALGLGLLRVRGDASAIDTAVAADHTRHNPAS